MGVRDYERNAGGRPRRRLQGARTPALALAATLAATALATAAHAQLGDGGLALDKQLELGQRAGELGVDAADTDYTPKAKETEKLWEHVAGARYGWGPKDGPERRGVIRSSATPFEADLYTVAFRNLNDGFAGGSEEIECEGPGGETQKRRVPVIYQYFENRNNVEDGWRQVPKEEIASDCDNPGYVGAIAWIGGLDRALAVGGTGAYPRREPAYREECQERAVAQEAPGVSTGLTKSLVGPYGSKCDPAGSARAWLYEQGSWRELDLSEQLANGMRGMSALAFHPLSDKGFELGVAGALGQLWRWGESFQKTEPGKPVGGFAAQPVTDARNSARAPVTGAGDGEQEPIRFRVRDVTFAPGDHLSSKNRSWFVAVTAGCCAETRAHNYPRLLLSDGTDGKGKADGGRTWSIAELGEDILFRKPLVTSPQLQPAPYLGHGHDEARRRGLSTRQDLPDSLYSVTAAFSSGLPSDASTGSTVKLSAIAAPGGPPDPNLERPSLVTNPHCLDWQGRPTRGELFPLIHWTRPMPAADPAFAALRASLSTARLVAGDGDSGLSYGLVKGPRQTGILVGIDDFVWPTRMEGVALRPSSVRSPRGGAFIIPKDCGGDFPRPETEGLSDGVPDWAVGELRSTHLEGLGARALAYSTTLNARLAPDVVNHRYAELDIEWSAELGKSTLTPPTPDLGAAFKQPTEADKAFKDLTTREKLLTYARSAYFLLPSYSLNAIDAVEGAGVYWAVGDHGAILRLGEGAAAKVSGQAEPPPPSIATRRREPLAERAPYDAHRPPPPAGELQAVPALGAGERLAHPRLQAMGSPDPSLYARAPSDDADRIVISRDGEQGWALGDGPENLYRYDGNAWSRCDPVGIEGQLEPDPACAVFGGPLREYRGARFSGGSYVYDVPAPVHLLAMARVPLERDSDPANDGEFELLATGSLYTHPGEQAETASVFRYRQGRWQLATDPLAGGLRQALYVKTTNPRSTGPHRIAFAAPDDAWVLDQLVDHGTTNPSPARLLHFDGSGWQVVCEALGNGPCANEAAGPLHGVKLKRAKLVEAAGRLYLVGSRDVADTLGAREYPVILHREAGGGDAWSADPAAGGHDPGRGERPDSATEAGTVSALALARGPGGGLEGWAGGSFGAESPTALLRFEPGRGWRRFADPAISDAGPVVIGRGKGGEPEAFVAQRSAIYAFDRERERFRALPGQVQASRFSPYYSPPVRALAADGEGGFWAPVLWHPSVNSKGRLHFLHYTDRPGSPFEEVPTPLREHRTAFTALAGTPEGTLWAATSTGVLYRYDRTTGWDRAQVPGWQPRRATAPIPARAIAAGPDGGALAVGAEGRIARVAAGEVSLDAATGVLCDAQAPLPPCGTGRDLRAVAIAPDGSAIVGGDRLALLWRPAGGEFRAVEPLAGAAPNAAIVAVSMPSPERAWLVTDTGLLFAGELRAGSWRWAVENLTAAGDAIPFDENRLQIPLWAIAVDRDGHGYAVGDRGTVLERTGDPRQPWRRLALGLRDDLTAVTLAPDGGSALVGGRNGLVLTGRGERFWVARPAGYTLEFTGRTGPVAGLALAPGIGPGQVEAWAATQGRAENADRREKHPRVSTITFNPNNSLSQLFHYASDPGEPLLNPARRARPLPDAPAPRPGELALVALGNTAGGLGPGADRYETVARRMLAELAARAQRPAAPELAIFSGDAVEQPGGGPNLREASSPHLEWRRSVLEPLAEAGLPLFATVGWRDLSLVPSVCPLIPARDPVTGESLVAAATCSVVGFPNHEVTHRILKLGENFAWRKAMAGEPRPWGKGAPAKRGSLSFRPVRDEDALSVREQDVEAAGQRLALDGARTHYAFDLVDDSRQPRELARVVVADNSNRSLAASDPFQQPLEARGGQSLWLERMLCVRGTGELATGRCTRKPHQPAIVVATTPTYSYGSTKGEDLAGDSTAFEALLMKHGANLVVSGRLGWNGRYWATAPGLHEPCPGGSYQTETPEPGSRACGRSEADLPATPAAASTATGRLAEAMRGLGAPPPPTPEDVDGAVNRSGVLPFVVASGAGGPLGAQGDDARADRGFWEGYTIARMDRSGDPRGLVVEQRPIFEWVHIEGATHVLRPGQRMTLRGLGRGPAGIECPPEDTGDCDTMLRARFDPIESAAVTHRYDLVEADPQRPWLPRVDPASDGPHGYVPVAPDVATVDSVTGRIRVGRGNHPRTFALGLLSVGEHVATYPLVFEPRRSFRPKPLQLVAPLPVPKVLSAAAAAIQSPQAPPPVNPPTPQVDIPPPPAIPPLPTPSANPPAPPAPPAPPPPPVSPQATPLDLVTSPVGLNVAPQATVIPPPAPPIQPAPPGGARREARQRQAATQKSGAEMGEGSHQADQASDATGGLAEQPPGPYGTAMVRRDLRRADGGSVVAVARREQPSAWARGALYGGGLSLAALALAAGYLTLRPHPRRRPPDLPAPAWNRTRRSR